MKAWLAMFLVALPIAYYKGLRDPIWCAVAAAYFYFAIPDREFNAGQLPYQVSFWGLGVIIASLLYRQYFRNSAKEEIDDAAMGAVRTAIEEIRADFKAAIVDAG